MNDMLWTKNQREAIALLKLGWCIVRYVPKYVLVEPVTGEKEPLTGAITLNRQSFFKFQREGILRKDGPAWYWQWPPVKPG